MKRKIIFIGIFTLILLAVLISGCVEKENVAIKDAYCDLNGHFKFTIQNPEDEEISLGYKWTLNDPSADQPVHKGEGSVTLQGLEYKNLSFSIPADLHKYHAQFYVIYLYLYLDGKQIYKYREQKSPYGWDYSVLPPVKFKEKPEHVYIAFETFVSKNEQDDFIIQIENMSYNPYKSQTNLKLSEFYITIRDKNGEPIRGRNGEEWLTWLTSEILTSSTQEQSTPQFYDVDGNNIISNFDYYVIPSNLSNNLDLESPLIEFYAACPFVYKAWDWRGELLQEEDRNAIIIKDISTNPENPTTLEGLEFIVEIQSKYGIDYANVEIVTCSGRGGGRVGIHNFHRVSQNEQNYTYSGKFEGVFLKDKTSSKCLHIKLEDNDVNERLVLYKLEL